MEHLASVLIVCHKCIYFLGLTTYQKNFRQKDIAAVIMLNLLAPELLFFLILAHSVYKM